MGEESAGSRDPRNMVAAQGTLRHKTLKWGRSAEVCHPWASKVEKSGWFRSC